MQKLEPAKVFNKLMKPLCHAKGNSEKAQKDFKTLLEQLNKENNITLEALSKLSITEEIGIEFAKLRGVVTKLCNDKTNNLLKKNYDIFFASRNAAYQELKPYADAYLTSKGIKMNKQTNSTSPQENKQSANTQVIEAYLEKKLISTGKMKITVTESKDTLRLKIYSQNPNRVIGRGGGNIATIKTFIKTTFHYKEVICLVEDLGGNATTKPKNRSTEKKRVQQTTINTTKKSLSNLKEIASHIKDFTDFSKNATHINIYIDEGWPGLLQDNNKRLDEGVIAGIVWIGESVDYTILPQVGTHQQGNPRILMNLLKCKNAMPFIMPITTTTSNAGSSYFELIEASVKILLGWLLPQLGKECNVNIYPEHFSEFKDFTEKTEYFQGLFKQVKEQNKYRYRRFNINLVQWREKEFEYIPYADLLAYLTNEHNHRSISPGIAANYKSFHGYLPLSLALFNLLTRLDNIENSKNIEDLFLLIDTLYGTRLYNHIKKDLLQRLANNDEIKLSILHAVEDKYYQKTRNLSKLRLYFNELIPFFSDLEENGSISTKLLLTLLKLQKANHNGNPEEVAILYDAYDELRIKAILNREFDLCVECDLNLAVHFNDRFMFEESKEIINKNISAEFFNYLKPEFQAKLFSSLGQSHSLLNEYENAEKLFDKALKIFSNSEFEMAERDADREQTTVYRLFNLLGSGVNASDLFALFFQNLKKAALRFASSPDIQQQYMHHLLLRFLYKNKKYTHIVDQYLKHLNAPRFHMFHPWELILMYQGLLIFEYDAEKAYSLFLDAVKICKIPEHGGVLNLIGAGIATVGNILFDDDQVLKKEALELIKATDIVEAENVKESLRDALSCPEEYDISDVLSLLPFNYH